MRFDPPGLMQLTPDEVVALHFAVPIESKWKIADEGAAIYIRYGLLSVLLERNHPTIGQFAFNIYDTAREDLRDPNALGRATFALLESWQGVPWSAVDDDSVDPFEAAEIKMLQRLHARGKLLQQGGT